MNKIKRGHLTVYSSNKTPIYDVFRSNELRGEVYLNMEYNDFCKIVVLKGDIGLGELFMEDKWKSPDLLSLIKTLLVNCREIQSKRFVSIQLDLKKNIQHHYDVGNDFYATFLDKRIFAYTCGLFFRPDDTLEDAQINKVETVIRKMDCKGNENILDMGCGWGNIARYVKEKTNANRVDGVTLSDEQTRFIHNNSNMKVYTMSYEDLPQSLNNSYDKIYSIGMLEHVGYSNYNRCFKKISDLLKQDGRVVLHTITYGPSIYIPDPKSTKQGKSFLSEYIFPGGQIPKKEWIEDAAATNGLQLVHLETYGGQHYGKTLMHWYSRLVKNKSNLLSMNYDMKLIKMYEFYFMECAALFFTGQINLTHFVFDKVKSLEQTI